MIVFPHPNCSTTCNILNQHLEVINTILRQLLYSIVCRAVLTIRLGGAEAPGPEQGGGP